MKTEYLLDRELEHVLAALTEPNRLACEVALHTGLRISDVLRLKTSELKPSFWVREAKTGKSKKIGLPAPLLKRLRAQAGDYWVFEGRSDPAKHRTRQAVWYDVKRAATAFRLPVNAGPHSLRKIYAVRLLREYGDISRVQRALNHSSPDITLIYAMADQLLQARHGSRRSDGRAGGRSGSRSRR